MSLCANVHACACLLQLVGEVFDRFLRLCESLLCLCRRGLHQECAPRIDGGVQLAVVPHLSMPHMTHMDLCMNVRISMHMCIAPVDLCTCMHMQKHSAPMLCMRSSSVQPLALLLLNDTQYALAVGALVAVGPETGALGAAAQCGCKGS